MSTASSFFTFIPEIVRYALAAAGPLLFASVGGLFPELGGMLNIALEGLIGLGAFFGMAAAGASGSLAGGALTAMAAGMAGALLLGMIVLRFRAHLFVVGLAINLAAGGITAILSQAWFGTKAVVPFKIPPVPAAFPPFLRDIPLLGPMLFSHSTITVSAWLWVLVSAIVIERSRFGLRLRATGMNALAVDALGVRADRYRMTALALSGIGCGLAGYALGVSISAYVPNIASGRGWIALVAIYLGRRKAGWVAAACLVFALAESFSNYLQGFLSIPPLLVLALPYAVTLVSLIAGGLRTSAEGM